MKRTASMRSRSSLDRVNLGICSLTIILLLMVTVIPGMYWLKYDRAIPGMYWSKYDRVGEVGPLEYELRAEFDSVGFMYNMSVSSSDEGGGLIGGIGGGVNISKEKEKRYTQVNKEFMDNIGILYDSYRIKEYEYEIKMDKPPQESGIDWQGINPSAYLNVSIEAEIIPFWPDMIGNEFTVSVTYAYNDLDDLIPDGFRKDQFKIILKSISIKAKTDYDGIRYRGEEITLHKKNTQHIFSNIGDTYTTTVKADYPKNTDQVGIFVVIEGDLYDYWGNHSNRTVTGNANPINLYPMENSDLFKGMGVPLSFPLLLFSILLLLSAIILWFVRKRWYLKLIVPAMILALVAPVWFYLGMGSAVSLLAVRLDNAEEGLSWGPSFYISLLGAVASIGLLVISMIIFFDIRRKKGEDVDGIPTFKPIPQGPDPDEGRQLASPKAPSHPPEAGEPPHFRPINPGEGGG